MIFIQEKELKEQLRIHTYNVLNNQPALVTNFSVRENIDATWFISFDVDGEPHQLSRKRGNIPRSFARINGVEKCLKKLGVSQFKVVMNLGKFLAKNQ